MQLIIDSADDYFLATPNVPIIARHRLGHQLTFAGIDHAGTEGAWLRPADPDASARALRDALITHTGADVAVVIADSDGRADRRGATVISIGAAGIAPLRITEHGGNRQEETFTDLIAAAAGIILGRRGRGAPVAALRGIAHSARAGESQQCSTTGHDTAGHRVADTIGIRLAVCLTCEGITLRLLNGGRYRAAGARTSRHPTHGKETMSLQVTEAASAEPAEAVRRVIQPVVREKKARHLGTGESSSACLRAGSELLPVHPLPTGIQLAGDRSTDGRPYAACAYSSPTTPSPRSPSPVRSPPWRDSWSRTPPSSRRRNGPVRPTHRNSRTDGTHPLRRPHRPHRTLPRRSRPAPHPPHHQRPQPDLHDPRRIVETGTYRDSPRRPVRRTAPAAGRRRRP
ncbi:coenzyme F420-0:L-glutamate ligase [Streptomyces thermoviolaceus]|uniref:coenzyme F420-0:L-glutamate ligase n=1 Tax=Streptomyces thermoviolaceus TaxID=1952 RepID=UPI0019CD5B76|nr:coenzyme F420-0:L-glutamate ligase [Streptomyces thermoviolaceus]GGV76222.1 hypothetical protein GCM10010499_33500 [Streptomyces thermoviolaceus subsp. apingens]